MDRTNHIDLTGIQVEVHTVDAEDPNIDAGRLANKEEERKIAALLNMIGANKEIVQVSDPRYSVKRIPESEALPRHDSKPAGTMDQPTVLSKQERQRIILLIQLYLNLFPDKLVGYDKVKFSKMTDEKLISLKDEFQFIVSSKTNIATTEYMFLQGVNLLEVLSTSFTPFKIKGLSTIVSNDDEFKDTIKQLCLKYMTVVEVQPEGKLLFKLASTMLYLHQFNSSNDGSTINKTNIDTVNEKYTDL